MSSLKKIKVLVLAGPTWMPIDQVRVMTNIFSGELGLLIAREFYRQGAQVTLVFGPGRRELIDFKKDKFKIIFFSYFNELLKIARNKSAGQKIIVNSAAIADYQPVKRFSGKIKSGQSNFQLNFRPTRKIIDEIRRINPRAILVKFKLEVDKTKQQLIKTAYHSLLLSKADYIVANDLSKIINASHEAFIIDKNRYIINSYTKKETAQHLVRLIKCRFGEINI